MADDLKQAKKFEKDLKKGLSKIILKCDKKKITKIPVNEFADILSLAEKAKDRSELLKFYNKYRSFIPESLLEKTEKILGIAKTRTVKKEPEIKKEPVAPVRPMESEPISYGYVPEIKYMSEEELADATKETLEDYKKQGFLFKIAKTHKKLGGFDADQAAKLADEYGGNVIVHWANDTDLAIRMGTIQDRCTVIDAIRKYKDHPGFMVRLNNLLGLSIYTPASAYSDEFKIEETVTYVDADGIERTKVLKHENN